MASRLLPAILIAVLVLALLARVQPAGAAPSLQTTDTPTPTTTATPTATPAYVSAYTLDSGNTLIVERRWSFGELAITLAIVANTALYGLHWIYEVTRREAR